MTLINQILRGVVIGIANLIPGVSGGTMMVSMGIYDTLIDCITHLFTQFKKSMLTLLPYLIGMLIGIFALAGVLAWCFIHYPLPTNTCFIGLILGGLAPIIHRIDKKRMNALAVFTFLVFFALIIGLALSHPAAYVESRAVATPVQMLMLLAVGAVASAIMLIPGVSGSMVMMLLGYYRPVLASVNDFTHGLLGGNLLLAAQQLLVLIPFSLGLLLGIYFIARGIGWLLRRWPAHTYCAVLGLVVASPVALLLGTDMAGISVAIILASIATFAVGFAASAWLSRGDGQEPPLSQANGSPARPAAADAAHTESPEPDGHVPDRKG